MTQDRAARALRPTALRGLVTPPVAPRVAALLAAAEAILVDGSDEERDRCSRAAAAIMRWRSLCVGQELRWRRSRTWRYGPGSDRYGMLPGVQGWFDHHYRLDTPADADTGRPARHYFVSEPYDVDEDDLRALLALSADYHVSLDGRALHFPGNTLRILFERRKDGEP